jgi:uncharacterized protein
MPAVMLVVAVVAAAGAGLVLGLLGGGGSILTLPILVYLAGLPTRPAIAASLLVVAATSTVAVVPHARAGRVRWRTALPFAAAGVLGAYGGGRLADLVPGPLLLAGFGLMAAVAAAGMLRPRRPRTAGPACGTPRTAAAGKPNVPGSTGTSSLSERVRLPTVVSGPVGGPDGSGGGDGTVPKGAVRDRSAGAVRHAHPAVAAVLGGLVGLVTGLVGAGGGFVIVPVLVVVAGLGMAEAVGTSLLVISVQSAAGLAGHLPSVRLDWPVVAAVTAAAIAGSLVGARLVAKVPQAALRTGFGWLVLAMAGLILAQQVPATLRRWLAGSPAGWAAMAVGGAALAAAVLVGMRCRCRRRAARAEPPTERPVEHSSH